MDVDLVLLAPFVAKLSEGVVGAGYPMVQQPKVKLRPHAPPDIGGGDDRGGRQRRGLQQSASIDGERSIETSLG